MSEVIAAISTPLGEGGIGTVRLSGEGATKVADKVFRAKENKRIENMAGYTAAFGSVFNDKEEKIDEAVALVFRAPKSYTGEDVVELSVHGGVFVLRETLRAVLAAGARLAEPGEFTKRAFLNKKMNLLEAESICSIISAGGEQEFKMARALKDGFVGREITAIKDRLLTVLAGVAVFSDYPDEDLPEANVENINGELLAVSEALSKLIENYDIGKIVREGVNTAIIGAPNVGKSTLMNLLSRTERSIVTAVAGTTRDVIEETVKAGDVTLRLADTAGVHRTADEVEAIGVGLSRRRAKEAQLVLAVFDGSRPLSEDDREILELIKDAVSIAVINKTDLPIAVKPSDFSGLDTVYISAENGSGYEELCALIAEKTLGEGLSSDAAVLMNERQRGCALRAKNSVDEALRALESGFTLDAVGICADEALSSLLELSGERITEAVANEVFSRFCVGK